MEYPHPLCIIFLIYSFIKFTVKGGVACTRLRRAGCVRLLPLYPNFKQKKEGKPFGFPSEKCHISRMIFFAADLIFLCIVASETFSAIAISTVLSPRRRRSNTSCSKSLNPQSLISLSHSARLNSNLYMAFTHRLHLRHRGRVRLP